PPAPVRRSVRIQAIGSAAAQRARAPRWKHHAARPGGMGVPGHMVRRIDVTGADGVRLAAWEFADPPKGSGEVDNAPGVLLLHGLMGRAAHWAGTARWLAARYRAIGLDQRGPGRSDKPAEGPYTREAYV